MRPVLFVIFGAALAAAGCCALDEGELTKLRDEATAIQKAYGEGKATPEEYAAGILKLEQALNILEKAGDTNSTLAQDITAQYFWAKRFSNVFVIKALEALRAKGGVVPPTRFDKPRTPRNPNDPNPDPFAEQMDAKKAFEEALAYVEKRKDDDMAVARRFFQMAGEWPGTDYGMKAMGLARDAILHFASKGAGQEEKLPETPEMEPVKKADALVDAGKYREAFPLYMASIRQKETDIAERRLGRAQFGYAMKLREEILAAWEELKPKLEEARQNAYVMNGKDRVFDPQNPRLAAAMAEQQKLVARVNDAKAAFGAAQRAFEAVVRLAAEKKDLEAAAYIALCLRGAERVADAKTFLQRFVKDYEPKSDYERILVEYGKIELESLAAKK
ncbi:MAG: hypothetical protein HY291_20915 [Planctomycetes bacterium]|nr:hypothetical protein [Planctomycetota bacterium]